MMEAAQKIAAQIEDRNPLNRMVKYLEQENAVLHAKVRQLEISLSSEREACAKIAEDYGKARYAYETEGGKSKQDAFTAANSIAQLIRGRA